jgi:hypothetical protein
MPNYINSFEKRFPILRAGKMILQLIDSLCSAKKQGKDSKRFAKS